MKVVVIGLGSMGKRRIRLLQKYNKNYEIIGVDTNLERCRQVKELFAIKTRCELSCTSINDGDSAFVCTSPVSHGRIIKQCLESNLHVFTELNLIDDEYDNNICLASRNNRVLFLSSTFLYRDEVEYIYKTLKTVKGKMNYTYHIGQYLPDWHPWENFKSFFVNDKRTNGCREIFAVELPWLTHIFGEIEKICVWKDKISELDIDYNDNYILLVQHTSGVKGTLSVDVVSRKPVRNFELYGEQIYLSWDGSSSGLYCYNFMTKENENIKLYKELDTIPGYSAQIIENAYLKEIQNFFHVIEGKEMPRHTFEQDKKILTWIDKIESSED